MNNRSLQLVNEDCERRSQQSKKPKCEGYRGFTLIELLLTISITSILLTIGIPTMKHFIVNNRFISTTNSIVSALQLARSEAIKHKTKTIFCKSQDHKTCGGNWQNGQIIINANKKILRVLPALPDGYTLIWNSSLGKNDFVEFSPQGFTSNGQKGTFYLYQDGNNKYGKKIIISQSGRIRISEGHL